MKKILAIFGAFGLAAFVCGVLLYQAGGPKPRLPRPILMESGVQGRNIAPAAGL